MTRLAALIATGLLTVSPLAAQDNNTSAPTVTGRWTMTVDAGPHGMMTMALTVKQERTTVTGTFSSPHGDMPVEGELVDGTLTLATTEGDGDSRITFNARLKDDTLAGYLSSRMGDMKFTAARIKDKP